MKIYEKFLIFNRTLSGGTPLIKPRKEIIIKMATELDVEKMRKEIGSSKAKKFLRRIKEKKVCMLAVNRDNIIYYRWMNFGKDNLVITKDKEVYLFDSYAWPEYRRLGVHTAATAECLRFAKEKGCENVIAAASFQNYPAQQTLRNLGFKETGRVSLINVPWFKKGLKWTEYNKC